MLLLHAPDHPGSAVPRPRRAAGSLGPQFVPQPGLELHGMQRAERRKSRRRFSPPPLPRTPPDRHRTRRPPPRPRRPRLRQAPPFSRHCPPPPATAPLTAPNRRASPDHPHPRNPQHRPPRPPPQPHPPPAAPPP